MHRIAAAAEIVERGKIAGAGRTGAGVEERLASPVRPVPRSPRLIAAFAGKWQWAAGTGREATFPSDHGPGLEQRKPAVDVPLRPSLFALQVVQEETSRLEMEGPAGTAERWLVQSPSDFQKTGNDGGCQAIGLVKIHEAFPRYIVPRGAYGCEEARDARQSRVVPTEREDPMEGRGIIMWIIIGLVAGGIAKLIMPGRDPGGIIVTILLGIAGSVVGGYLGGILFGTGVGAAGLIGSIIGALILLALYRMWVGRRATV